MNFELDDLMKMATENPEMLAEIVSGLVSRFKPMVYRAAKEILNIYRDYAECDEIFELNAKVHRKGFEALVKEGFTEDQAMALLLRDNIRLNDALKDISKSASVKFNK